MKIPLKILKNPHLFKPRKTPYYFSLPGLPLEPPAGQKCKGRNYEGGRDCCTVTEPCGIGETKHWRNIGKNRFVLSSFKVRATAPRETRGAIMETETVKEVKLYHLSFWWAFYLF